MRVGPWKRRLESSGFAEEHPAKAQKILDAIEYGVSVEFEGDRDNPVRAHNRTNRMSQETIDKVTAIIEADCKAKKKAGPFATLPFANLFVSPIGAVPKHNSSKVRVIHNLSHPFYGDSVNAGIPSVAESCQRFKDAADAVVRTGRGCFLVKLDVEAAYKQIPVNPADWHLLGFKWLDRYFYERVLPFGLRSSCRIWELFAHALHYFLAKMGIPCVIHYVDDFLFVIELKPEAERFLPKVLALCRELGIPMADDKTEGPTCSLVFLGILLDTEAMTASLPHPKLIELRQLTEEWSREVTTKRTIRDYQSMHGKLSWACQVVRPGRFFTRRLIERASLMAEEHGSHSMKGWATTKGIREDMQWWSDHLQQWNGVGLLYDQEWINDRGIVTLETDACAHGYGAVWGELWFAGAWRPDQMAVAEAGSSTSFSIAFLELHAIVQAAATWGHLWSRKRVCFLSDSSTSVADITSKGSHCHDGRMTHLLRELANIACKHNFDFKAEHIPGLTNIHADVLSRFGDCQKFREQRPEAALHPSLVVPIPLPDMSQERPSARSARKRKRTSTSPSPPPPESPTGDQLGRNAPIQITDRTAVLAMWNWMREKRPDFCFQPRIFHSPGGPPLTCSRLMRELNRAAAAAGLGDMHFQGRSLRRGGATGALLAGATPGQVQARGRWAVPRMVGVYTDSHDYDEQAAVTAANAAAAAASASR